MAFLFFGLAYLSRYFLFTSWSFGIDFAGVEVISLRLLFHYFVSVALLMLAFSLVWKESNFRAYCTLIIHVLALGIVGLNEIFSPAINSFIYGSQLAICGYALVVSHDKYKQSKANFMGVYFIGLLLYAGSWLTHAASLLLAGAFKEYFVYSYLFSLAFFGLFLYSVLKVTKKIKWQKKESD